VNFHPRGAGFWSHEPGHPGDIVGSRGLGDAAAAPPIPIHFVFSILPLGEIDVVGPAPETDRFGVVGASPAERIVVVELEPPALRAAPTLLVDKPAAIM